MKKFDYIIGGVALFAFLVLIVENSAGFIPYRDVIRKINFVIFSLFAIDVVITFFLSKDKKRYIRHHWFDLIVFIPLIQFVYGSEDVDVAIVCIGEHIEANLLTTLLLKKLGVRKIWARAISPLQQEILRILEVDSIINLEEEMGKIIAGSLVSISLTRRIPLTSNHSLAEIKIPESFIGKTIRQIDPRKNFKITIVAIKKKVPQIDEHGERSFEELLEDVPSFDSPLDEEDVLLIIGENENIEKFSMV